MRYAKLVFVIAFVVGTVTGCRAPWQAEVAPPRGLLITAYRAPLTTEFRSTSARGRLGTASALYFRDPLFTGMDFAWDDASIDAAARNGGLTRVTYADYEVLQILGIFGRFTTRVHGE